MLELDPEQQSGDLPWLSGQLREAAPARLKLVQRVHNRAGIPIIERQSQIEAGERQVSFTNLHALGIDAYAYKTEAGRAEIAQRIWSLHIYGTHTR